MAVVMLVFSSATADALQAVMLCTTLGSLWRPASKNAPSDGRMLAGRLLSQSWPSTVTLEQHLFSDNIVKVMP